MNISSDQVLLLVPPFFYVSSPPLGVNQLKANLIASEIPCKVLYTNLWYAKRIGLATNQIMTDLGPAGEVVFAYYNKVNKFSDCETIGEYSKQAWFHIQNTYPELAGYLQQVLPFISICEVIAYLIEEADSFIQKTARTVLEIKPALVGFTISTSQTMAALAIAHALKEKIGNLPIIFGGPGTISPAGQALLDHFPQIDFIGQGECDHLFVEFAKEIFSKNRNFNIPGILQRNGAIENFQAPILDRKELDKNLPPDFDEFLEAFADVRKKNTPVALRFETNRGCLWGQYKKCIFCANNPYSTSYRCKSADRIEQDIRFIVKKSGLTHLIDSGSCLDLDTHRELFKKLKMKKIPCLRLLFEILVNPIEKEDVVLMADAGVRWLGLGIEGVSNHSLRLMKKRNRVHHNITILKWVTENGICPIWFYILIVPGEREEDTDDILSLIKRLIHMPPPNRRMILNLERTAPLVANPSYFKIDPIRPFPIYTFLFGSEDLAGKMAWFQETRFFKDYMNKDYVKNIDRAIRQWQRKFWFNHLVFFSGKRGVWLLDTRSVAKKFLRKLDADQSKIYLFCDQPRSLNDITIRLDHDLSEEEIKAILDLFIQNGLMIKNEGFYVSLAIELTSRYRTFELSNHEADHSLFISNQEYWNFTRHSSTALWKFYVGIFKRIPLFINSKIETISRNHYFSQILIRIIKIIAKFVSNF
uniref:Ribosomal peptide maturation radical SAM protein 1 n=1 Tax=Candidatus Kentrum sp. LFY TaxID=2126342 RepID=A0A450UUB7_9GAMM|nr:MAG: ribosomal peptide maturation radical SAM protein 1 [Candidatus Kentron sp. LFY]